MSKSSKTSSNSTTNQNSTLTTTPTNPEWVTNSTSALQDHINNLLNTDPQSLVPGASALQTQAFGRAGDLGAWKGQNNVAAGITSAALTANPQAQTASAPSLLSVDLGQYANPALSDVVKTSLADFDQNAGATRAALAADQARGMKFGGSRSAISTAMTEDQLARAREAADASLRYGAFDRASGLAENDLGRQTDVSQFNAGQANSMATGNRDAMLRAAGLLGDLSNSTAANDRADVGLLADTGAQQREVSREVAGAPASLLSLIASLNAQQPYGLYHGQTGTGTGTTTTNGSSTTTSSDPLGTFGSLLAGAGSLATGLGAGGLGLRISDKRAKTDIETVGKDKKGRRVVSYRYKGEPKGTNRVGYLAQDVEKTDPHAVTTLPGGLKAVNYGLLGMA